MPAFIRTTSIAGLIAAAAVLAACGGGGSSSPIAPQAHPTPLATNAPAAATRTAVGSAKLTLVFPQTVNGTTVKAVRAVPGAAARTVQYINPSPAPSAQAYAGNVIDLYVDGSLIPNVDGSDPSNTHSVVLVNTAPTGSQTITLPLYSTARNSIVAVEYDYNASHPLAIGDTEAGTFTAGQPQTLAMTMQMNAVSVGFIDYPTTTTHLLDNSGISYPCPASGQTFALFSADWEGVFVPAAGYGGTNTPVASASNPLGGSSTFGFGTSGAYTIFWDGSCTRLRITANVANPAFAIYNDVTNTNFSNYYSGFYGNYSAGPNQGIFNMYWGSGFDLSPYSASNVGGYLDLR